MKALAVTVLCILLQATAVGDLILDATVSVGDAVIETVAQNEMIAENEANDNVMIPDTTGMTESDAMAVLEAVVLPDGTALEIIKNYAYSAEIAADIVYEQSLAGEVAAADAGQVHISISLGQEPDEILAAATQEVSPLSTFGLARYIEPEITTANSQFGIDWDSLPATYVYNWDNSANCWYWGVWIDGVCYKTPEGTYSTDVRHKAQLYCDGEYVYLRIVFSRDYGAKVNGDNYNFYINDDTASFRVVYKGGETLTDNTAKLEPGTHEVEVRHGNGSISWEVAQGSLAYLTKHETDVNAELEMRIPLSEMVRQNQNIKLDNVETIRFASSNIMDINSPITASGASTYPMASAAAALLLVPGSTALLKRFDKKKKKDHNE